MVVAIAQGHTIQLKMSKTFEAVLSSLRELTSTNINDLEALGMQHQDWLTSAVGDVKAKILALGKDINSTTVGYFMLFINISILISTVLIVCI